MITTQEQEESRWGLIIRNIPEVLVMKGHILYVGGSPGKIQLVNKLIDNYTIDLLEVHFPNFIAISKEGVFDRCVWGDVRDIDRLSIWQPKKYDITIWWHGPEHVRNYEMVMTLKKLEHITESLILLGCPYGKYEQGEIKGNIYERHFQALYPDEFVALGYEVSHIGEPDSGPESCLIAWKWLIDRSENNEERP